MKTAGYVTTVIRPFRNYRVGQVITPPGGLRDALRRRGLVRVEQVDDQDADAVVFQEGPRRIDREPTRQEGRRRARLPGPHRDMPAGSLPPRLPLDDDT